MKNFQCSLTFQNVETGVKVNFSFLINAKDDFQAQKNAFMICAGHLDNVKNYGFIYSKIVENAQ